MKPRFHVLYCDDEARLRKKFIASHVDSDFSFSELEDVESLPRILADMPRLPDLLVLDVFHSITTPGTKEALEGDRLVAKKFEEFYEKLREVKEVSDRYKRPRAIHILNEIRSNPKMRDLPVLLYTRQGLALISDEELQDTIENGAEWMLRGRKPETERRRMYNFIIKNRPKNRIERDVLIAIVSTIVGLLLSKLF